MTTELLEQDKKKIAIWLFICCFMVFLMVMMGGITRLTHSGLSMVEWKPITGAIPPFSEEAWQGEFLKYQDTPEYQKVNFDMDLVGFKKIYLIEFFHRNLGRLTGLVFLLPFLFFYFKKKLPTGLSLRLLGIFALGGAQGFMGWYMVKSGLVNDPDVSQYRLASHLVLAFIIYSLLLWEGFKLSVPKSFDLSFGRFDGLKKLSILITLVLFFQIIFGGFTAGLNAGLVYNTFPLMLGKIVPDGLFKMEPWFLNFFENVITVQFTHRFTAIFLGFLVVLLVVLAKRKKLEKEKYISIMKLMVVVFAQISLGIATLIYAVPFDLALLHQVFALIVLTNSLFVNYQFCAK